MFWNVSEVYVLITMLFFRFLFYLKTEFLAQKLFILEDFFFFSIYRMLKENFLRAIFPNTYLDTFMKKIYFPFMCSAFVRKSQNCPLKVFD